MTDPFVGQLAFFRVYSGHLDAGSCVFNSTKDSTRAHRPPAEDARQQARRDQGSLRRRHRGGRRPEERLDGRHDLRRERAGHPRGDELPRARHRGRHRAQDQGRPGKDGHGARQADAGRPDLQGPHGQGDGADHHPRDGRAAPGDHHGPHGPRVQRRRQHRQAPGRLPRGDHARKPRAHGRFIRQSGGRGQYGECKIRIKPAAEGHDFVFENEIYGGVDPQGVHQADRAGHQGSAGDRRSRRLPDDGRARRAVRRLVPRRGLLGNGLQDRGLDGLPGRGQEGQARSSRSRSWRSRSSCPRTTWATSSAT